MLEWSRNVPILIVTLARPELLEIRPGWGARRRNFLALDLEPLAEGPMRELLKGLVPDLSESAVRSIVARAEGIPLYAVETIRMLAADGRLRELPDGGFEPVGEVGDLAVPDSLHALIAARLDVPSRPTGRSSRTPPSSARASRRPASPPCPASSPPRWSPGSASSSRRTS